MIGFRFRSNLHELGPWLRMLATEQVPYASAVALTRTAQDAQGDVRVGLRRHFTIRSSFTEGGIRIVPASKRDWPRMASIVGTRDEWLAQHEDGGTKKPAKGASNVAIPTRASVRRRNAGGRLPRTAKPRALLDRKDTFVDPHAPGGLGKALRQRVKGPRKKGRTGADTIALFLFRPQAHLEKRLGMRDTVEATVQRVYATRFREAFESAIKAPKRPGKMR